MTACNTPSPGFSNAASPDAPRGQTELDLEFGVASSLEQVSDAWSLVYSAYTRIGLIGENPFSLHAMPQAVGPHATVVTGRLGGQSVCTMTTLFDNSMGLPLDSVYRSELDAMRQGGHKLMELGLFADRRERIARSLEVLRELMRWAFHIGETTGHGAGIIGVHPHHVGFYTRMFGFEVFGPEKSYATVRDHPVVPLRLTRQYVFGPSPKPRGLRYVLEHPLPPTFLDHRCSFAPPAVAASPIGHYLRWRESQSAQPSYDQASAA